MLKILGSALKAVLTVLFWTVAVAVPGIARGAVRLLGLVLVLPHFRSWPR